MRRITRIILLVVLSLRTNAQLQDPEITQNMFLIPFFNPGAIGHSDKICAAAAFRNQTMGFPGAPVTMTFTAHAPFKMFGSSHGVGINLSNDNAGYDNEIGINLAYSYKISMGSGILGIGANVGLTNPSLTPDWATGDALVDASSDQAIPDGDYSVFGLDLGAGLYYSTDKVYFGISSTHINQPNFQLENNDLATPSKLRYYYAMGGYTIQLANPMLELLPSFMIQTNGTMSSVYLNTNLRYNKRFWGGVTYLVGGGISVLAGIELMNGIRVGYSYGVELSRLVTYNSGSHEITVRYCFDLSLDKTPQKYESIRFL